MPDVPPGNGVPDVFEDAAASRDELRRLPHAGARVEITDGQHGEPERGGSRPKPLDPGLSFVNVAASELRTIAPSIAASHYVWLEFPFA